MSVLHLDAPQMRASNCCGKVAGTIRAQLCPELEAGVRSRRRFAVIASGAFAPRIEPLYRPIE